MEEINSIETFLSEKISQISEIIFFEKNYKCVESSDDLNWIDFVKLLDLHEENIWKSEITLHDNSKKNICIKINKCHSLVNTEGKEFLEEFDRKKNIYTKLNNLKENNSWINYNFSEFFIKSGVLFKNTNFLNWSQFIFDKYISVQVIEYLENYITFYDFIKNNTFQDNLKILIEILDISKILTDNNLIFIDFHVNNILIKGDISSHDIKLIDYENILEITTEEINSKTLSSIYELEYFHEVTLKDKKIINSEIKYEPEVFCYIYMRDYLYLLSSFSGMYFNTNEYDIVYGIIKHCVDNKLNVTEAKNYIQTNFIDTA